MTLTGKGTCEGSGGAIDSVGSWGCGAAEETRALTQSFFQTRMTFFRFFLLLKLLFKNVFVYIRKDIHKCYQYCTNFPKGFRNLLQSTRALKERAVVTCSEQNCRMPAELDRMQFSMRDDVESSAGYRKLCGRWLVSWHLTFAVTLAGLDFTVPNTLSHS